MKSPEAAEPLFDLENPGASMRQINQMVLPIRQPIMQGLYPGETLSNMKGPGYDHDGAREYVPGDDVRDIDWALTARQPVIPGYGQIPMVRERFRDVTPNVWVATDTMRGHNAATPGHSYTEQQLGLSVATAVMLFANKERMATGLVAANNYDLTQSKRTPERGRRNLVQLGHQIRSLAEYPDRKPEGVTPPALKDILQRTGGLATGNVVVIVSDFRDVVDPHDEEHGWARMLQGLRSRQNEVVAVELINPWDFQAPEYADRLKLRDKMSWLGRGKDARAIHERYAEITQQQQGSIDQTLKDSGATHIKISTTEPRWFSKLAKSLHSAKKHKQ